MKSKFLGGSLIVAAAVLAVCAAAATAVPPRQISCTLRTTTLIEPGSTSLDPTATKGHDFGYKTCSQPLGRGVHVDSSSLKPQSGTTGTITLLWKSFVNTGTYHGTARLRYTVTSSTRITYSGTGTITGGTGTLSHASGTLKLRCTSTDAGIHAQCRLKITLR
jgi:hypothetical protein